MVRHIVTWRLLPGRTAADVGSMKEALEGLVGQVEGLRHLEIGIDLDPGAPGHAEVVLYSEFESFQAVRDYAVHPLHVQAARLVPEVCTDRRASDHEVPTLSVPPTPLPTGG